MHIGLRFYSGTRLRLLTGATSRADLALKAGCGALESGLNPAGSLVGTRLIWLMHSGKRWGSCGLLERRELPVFGISIFYYLQPLKILSKAPSLGPSISCHQFGDCKHNFTVIFFLRVWGLSSPSLSLGSFSVSESFSLQQPPLSVGPCRWSLMFALKHCYPDLLLLTTQAQTPESCYVLILPGPLPCQAAWSTHRTGS